MSLQILHCHMPFTIAPRILTLDDDIAQGIAKALAFHIRHIEPVEHAREAVQKVVVLNAEQFANHTLITCDFGIRNALLEVVTSLDPCTLQNR